MCFGGGSTPTTPNLSSQANASSQIGSTAQQAAGNLTNYAQQGAAAQGAATTAAQGTLNNQAGSSFGAGATGQTAFGNAAGAANSNLAMAQNWGSPAGVAQAQGSAAAGTAQSYDAARMNNQRQLAAYGVDPSTLKGGFANLQSNLGQAGATSTNVYNAGQQRQLQGFGMTGQAIGQQNQLAQTGQGYTGAGASMTGQGVQLGNQTLATGTQAQLAPSQFDQTALAGYGQSANIQSQQYQDQLAGAQFGAQQNSSMMSGIGTLAGAAIGTMIAPGIGTAAGAAIGSKLADGGAIPARPGRHYADGGDAFSIPQTSYSAMPNPGESINPGVQMADGGSAKRQLQRKRALPANGAQYSNMAQNPTQGGAPGMGTAGPMTFADGGDINVPSINIQPTMPTHIDPGAAYKQPQQSSSPLDLSGLAGAGGGGGAAAPAAAATYSPAELAAGADGGQLRRMPSNQAVQAGPTHLANGGGMAEVNPNPMRQGGVPMLRPQHQQHMFIPNTMPQHQQHMTQVPQGRYADGGSTAPTMADLAVRAPNNQAQINQAMPGRGMNPQMQQYQQQQAMQQQIAPQYADGGLPGATWSMGSVADGGSPHNPQQVAAGGMIQHGPSDGTGIDDQVHAKVSVGEYVVPADVVHAKGKEFFDKLISRYHTPAQQQRQQMGIPQRGMQ